MNAIQQIPLDKLFPSKENVRKTDNKASLDGLAASIFCHGLRQNLNVKPRADGEGFEVVAGGRRYRAMLMLVKDGKLLKDAAIPCRLLTEGENATEISLVENTLREAMHPDDECSTFCGLIEKQGMTIEDVGARFGITAAVVKQRLKLAKVSPKLRGLFRKGEITLAQMMEFAISDDHKAQESVWDELDEWDRKNYETGRIKEALTEEAVHADSKLAKFVGIEAYQAAGGSITRDLFDAEDAGYLNDPSLLTKLVKDKLDEEAEAVRAEGWKRVDIDTENTYLAQKWSQHGRIKGTSAKAKATAGAVLYIDRDGKLIVERGLLDATAKKEAERAAKVAKANREGVTVADEPESAGYSAALIEDLTAHRRAALRVELAKRPDIALALTVHALAMSLLNVGHDSNCIGIRASAPALEGFTKVADDSTAHKVMLEMGAVWGEKLPAEGESKYSGLDSDEVRSWCIAQTQSVLLNLLAFLTALSIDAVVAKNKQTATGSADHLARVLKLDMHTHWTPSVEGFFGRLSKAQMEAALKEAGVKLDISKDKKAEAAAKVHKALAGKAWLPEVLRFAS